MSSGKSKSLKLQRSSQRAENATKVQAKDTMMLSAEEASARADCKEKSSERSDSLTPLHSTPKRSSERSDATRDHAGMDYRVSPILLPCTQEGANEVAWDWESPLTKKAKRKYRNSVESTGTPKRATALQKKRSSNSPLLYKPIKRQLMKNDPQQESLEKFTAEMKALSEQIKALPKEAQGSAARVDEEETDDELLIRIDIGDFEGETKLKFTTNNDNANRGDVVVLKTSLDDFFDDSIDDSMVKCSQEVEEKLKLVSSCGGRVSKSDSTNSGAPKGSSWHQQPRSGLLAARERSDEAVGTSSSSRRVTIETSETKTSSTAPELSSSSASASNKFNPTSDKKSMTFSLQVPAREAKSSNLLLKAPSNETKTSTFSMKFPTSSEKRSNVSATIASTSSKPSFINNNAKGILKESSSIGSSLADMFEIPDDSFDDFLAVCFDDEDMASTTEAASSRNDNDGSSRHHAKTSEARNSTRSSVGNPLASKERTATGVPFPVPQQASGVVIRSSNTANSLSKASTRTVLPRSVSNDSLKPSTSAASIVAAPPSQSSANQTRKFFKTKSLSTSSFNDQGARSAGGAASSGSKGWKSNVFINGNATPVSTQEQKTRQVNESQNNAWPRSNGNFGNSGMSNVNRNAPREDDNVRYKSSNGCTRQGGREPAAGSQSTQICTPEEIERKRLEAKMKLEAKRKLMARSTSSGTLSAATAKLPIKR